jgi:hypothetical protein
LYPHTLLVYGSFLSTKEEPNDIDVLLHGLVKNDKTETFRIQMVRSKGLVHAKCEVSVLKPNFVLMKKNELIKWFLESEKNKAKGITVDNCVQIDF